LRFAMAIVKKDGWNNFRSRAAINIRLCAMVSGDACSASFGSARMEAAVHTPVGIYGLVSEMKSWIVFS
jgi:hypothetical protein